MKGLVNILSSKLRVASGSHSLVLELLSASFSVIPHGFRLRNWSLYKGVNRSLLFELMALFLA